MRADDWEQCGKHFYRRIGCVEYRIMKSPDGWALAERTDGDVSWSLLAIAASKEDAMSYDLR